ncbi:MAG TPA: 5,10-methylenetetrahydrofolate reductase [Proteobacteria bacterium]|nr:5,10-methylenetetrahydrofolate reductase [Pseudomonadota bacterium]
MLRSEWKPFEEIVGYLDGVDKVFILGCDGCANASGTGGLPQVLEMKAKLTEAGKEVVGYSVIDFLCQKALVASRLRAKEKELESAGALLVLACGVGVQAVAAVVPKPVVPGCNTVSLGGLRGEWQGTERCMECGDCLLAYTGGICPLTACSKGLNNGACGGAKNGMCEVSDDKPCGWELIYKRLKELGQLDRLKTFLPPKSYAKARPRNEWLKSSIWALEQKD